MDTLPFETIGRFHLDAAIGQGGMGVVYRASDPILQRPVAIKLLAPHLGADPNAKARLQREASLIGSLKHTHIASIYEFGEHESRPYIAMEWIAGRTLKQLLLEDGALPQDRALRLFNQLSAALSYAHDNGVIHRDLKPSNIIVNSLDQVTVVDFGLAWIADAPSLTATGSVIGTPLYMSPEQIQGGDIDGRSDQYALAVILYEMLTGTTPFANDSTTALYHQQLFAPPPPITEHDPTIPLYIEQALGVALEKSAESRHRSIEAFQAALSPATAAAVKEQQLTKRNLQQMRNVALGLFAVIAIAVAGIYFFPTLQASWPSRTVLQPNLDFSWPLTHLAPYQTRFVAIELADARFEQAWAAYFNEESIADPVILDGRIVLNEWERLVGLDWATGEVSWETPLAELPTAPLAAFDSWDDSYLYVAPANGGVTALAAEDRQLLWQVNSAEFEGSIQHIISDNDELLILTTDANKLYGITTYSGESRFSMAVDAANISAFPPTVSGAGIFLVDTELKQVMVVDSGSNSIDWRSPTQGVPTTPPVVLGNDVANGVVLGTNDGVVQAFSLLNGRDEWTVNVGSAVAGIASDWWRVFATTAAGVVYAIDGTSGEVLWSVNMKAGAVGAPIITDDLVLTSVDDGSVRFFSADEGVELRDMRIKFNEDIASSPILVGDWLFLRTDYGIFAYAP